MDGKRKLTLAEEYMAEAQMEFYAALADDGVIDTDEARRIQPHFDKAYLHIVEAEAVERLYEYARKNGAEHALPRAQRESVSNLLQFRLRTEAKATKDSDLPPAA